MRGLDLSNGAARLRSAEGILSLDLSGKPRSLLVDGVAQEEAGLPSVAGYGLAWGGGGVL